MFNFWLFDELPCLNTLFERHDTLKRFIKRRVLVVSLDIKRRVLAHTRFSIFFTNLASFSLVNYLLYQLL